MCWAVPMPHGLQLYGAMYLDEYALMHACSMAAAHGMGEPGGGSINQKLNRPRCHAALHVVHVGVAVVIDRLGCCACQRAWSEAPDRPTRAASDRLYLSTNISCPQGSCSMLKPRQACISLTVAPLGQVDAELVEQRVSVCAAIVYDLLGGLVLEELLEAAAVKRGAAESADVEDVSRHLGRGGLEEADGAGAAEVDARASMSTATRGQRERASQARRAVVTSSTRCTASPSCWASDGRVETAAWTEITTEDLSGADKHSKRFFSKHHLS